MLAASKQHQATLLDMRARVDRWIWETDDRERFAETLASQQ
jgi:hypothetical protein